MLVRSLLFIVVFLTLCLRAEHVEAYHVEVRLESSGVFHVKEEILYNFRQATKETHGIYRYIPTHVELNSTYIDIGLKNFTAMQDATPVELSISNPYHGIFLRLGSSDQPVYGKHLYTIEYDVADGILPSAFNSHRDMLFWNAIGDKWEVPIYHATVDFFLPEVLAKPYVLYPEDKEHYRWIDDHHLQVNVSNLNTYSGLAVAIEFPAGLLEKNTQEQYDKVAMVKKQEEKKNVLFLQEKAREKKRATDTKKAYGYGMWIVFVLFALIWYANRKFFGYVTEAKSRVVRYYPPKGLSLLQSALLYDKFADNKDVSAAILELASLKYLVIIEENERTFLLQKEKPVEALSQEQKTLLEGLFAGGKRYELKQKEKADAYAMQKSISMMNDTLYQWAVESGHAVSNFTEHRKKLLWIFVGFISLLSVGAFIIFPLQYSMGHENQKIAVLTCMAFLPALIYSFNRADLRIKLIVALSGLFLVWLLELSGILNMGDLKEIDIFINPLFFLFLTLIVLIDSYQHTGYLTTKGMEVSEYLRGLEEFTLRVKKDEIERLLKEDRHYLEKMLPYAMLFGQVEHWLRFYDLLDVPKPSMSNGSLKSLSSLSSSFASSSTAPSSSSSRSSYGGSYGGGGYSGGGGGGGGGSW